MQLITEVVGDLGVIRVVGDVDHDSADRLDECAAAMLSNGSRSLVFDLAGVAFLDSSGLRVLIRVRELAHQRAGTISVRHAAAGPRRVMSISGLESLLVPDHDGATDER